MFERFTDPARRAVVVAQEVARERKADEIRTEHLLEALFEVPDDVAVQVLARLGVDRDAVRADVDALRPPGRPPLDAEALSTLGIDLDEVRRQVEDAFGPGALDRTHAAAGGKGPRRFGHIPFARTTKKALELALREAVHLEHGWIGTEHLLLGLLHTETGAAHHVLVGRGLTLPATRALVAEAVRGRRAG